MLWHVGEVLCRKGTWKEDCHTEPYFKALSRVVSLPFRRAIARLVPSVCGTVPPREGGPHVRLSHRIVHHAMAKQLPLS